MRTLLTACIVAVGLAMVSPAHAQVTVQLGQQPYWQTHHENEWQERREFREEEHQKQEWQREHCVRDWSGRELCRR